MGIKVTIGEAFFKKPLAAHMKALEDALCPLCKGEGCLPCDYFGIRKRFPGEGHRARPASSSEGSEKEGRRATPRDVY